MRDERGRFVKGGSNGRPKGARNKSTELVKALLDGKSEVLMLKAIEMAMAESESIMGKLLDRIYPVPKGDGGPADQLAEALFDRYTSSPRNRLPHE